MKIYTGTGDRGMTSLFSGERVVKYDNRVEAYGDIDELNSVLGVLSAFIDNDRTELINEIQKIQSDLFRIGALLATSRDSSSVDELENITSDNIAFLESSIDKMEVDLKPLRNFILPGGDITSAWAHFARTVCRRVERNVLKIREAYQESILPGCMKEIIIYLNRLSDYLFVLARYCNKITGNEDITREK